MWLWIFINFIKSLCAFFAIKTIYLYYKNYSSSKYLTFYYPYFFSFQLVMSINHVSIFRKINLKSVRDRKQSDVNLPMSGGYSNSILTSTGKKWAQQASIIHPWIHENRQGFITLSEKTPISFPKKQGSIEIYPFILKHISNISSSILGLHPHKFPYKQVLIQGSIIYLLNLIFSYNWKIKPSYNLQKHIEKNNQLFSRLKNKLGHDEAVGCFHVLKLGSTLPESTILCDILIHLGENPEIQNTLYQILIENKLEKFMRMVYNLIRKFTYFKYLKKITTSDQVLDNYTIPKNTICGFPIGKYNERQFKYNYTWGFGLRQCPGKMIGLDVISIILNKIIKKYQFTSRKSTFKQFYEKINIDNLGESYLFGKTMLVYHER